MSANYRKLNDGSHNSSKYHKKDGTPVRAILKRETQKITADQWAESGGTIGMVAKGVRNGSIEIVPVDLDELDLY